MHSFIYSLAFNVLGYIYTYIEDNTIYKNADKYFCVSWHTVPIFCL